MRAIFAMVVVLALTPMPSEAGFCPPPEWRESVHYPRTFQTYPPESWVSPETVFAIIATAIIFFILGKVASVPSAVDKKKILDNVDKIVKGGKDTADRYGKKDKLEKPLDAIGTDIKKMLNDAIPS